MLTVGQLHRKSATRGVQGREGCPQDWPIGVYVKLHASHRARCDQRLADLGLQYALHGGHVDQIALRVDAEAAARLERLVVER